MKALSLFANVGVAEAYLKDIGLDVVVANELEEKANAMLDKANAMQELNGNSNDVEDLMAKYDSTEQGNSAVDDELAALKAQMGIE